MAAGRRAPFRVVIITGASSGLGAELAVAYAAPAVTLGLLGRDRQRLSATAVRCAARGAKVDVAAIDVTEAAAKGSWLGDLDRVHRVELVIANAGTSSGPEPHSPSEGLDSAVGQIRVNLVGAINTVEPLRPAMRGHGRIAVVASIAAYRGLLDSPGYCASKAGLRAYAESLRSRLAPRGVGVTMICPGFIDSLMTDRFEGPMPFLVRAEAAAQKVKRAIDRDPRRSAFPWRLVFGLRFCDLAAALIGDLIFRHYRFHIRAA